MSEELSARLRRVEQQVRVFKELHQSELQIILDELTDIARQVDAERTAAASPAQASDVDSVIIDGQLVMRDGKLLTIDEKATITTANVEARKLIDRA